MALSLASVSEVGAKASENAQSPVWPCPCSLGVLRPSILEAVKLTLPQAFGNAVRSYRAARGMSQMQLAALAEMHLNAVGAIERGDASPNLLRIDRLAKALGITMSELLKETEKDLKGKTRAP